MNNVIKKILLSLGIGLGIITLILFLIGNVFEKPVGKMALSGINNQLTTKLSVKEFDLSLLRSFPFARITLKGVSLPGKIKEGGILLEAKSLSLKFGLLGIITGNYKVNSVLVEDGAIVAVINKKGERSFDIFKHSEDTTGTAAEFDLTIKKAVLKDIELIYSDLSKKIEIFWNVSEAGVSGEFSDKRNLLDSYAKIHSEFLEMPEGRYFVGKDLSYDGLIDINTEKGIFSLNEMEFSVDANSFLVNGNVIQKHQGSDVDIEFTCNDGSIQSVIGLLPNIYKEKFKDLNSSGKFNFEGRIKGLYSERENPQVTIDFGLEEGKINSPGLDYSLRDVTFQAGFTNGLSQSTKSSQFEVSDFKGYLKNEPVNFGLTLKDLDDPQIEFTFKGNFPLSGIEKVLNDPSVSSGGGEIEVESLKISGKLSDMMDPKYIYRVRSNGKLEFDDAWLKINGHKLMLDRGEMLVENNDVHIKDLHLEAKGNDIIFHGGLKNLLPVLLADSLNTKQAELKFDGILKANEVDLYELEKMFTFKSGLAVETDSMKQSSVLKRERLTSKLTGAFSFNIRKFKYKKINGELLEGTLIFEKSKVKLVGTTVDAMRGNMILNGVLSLKGDPRLDLEVVCEKIDIREFFRQNENFGQKVLTDANIKGALDSKIIIEAFWDKSGNFLKDKLVVLGDASLKNGELLNFELLESFAAFVKVQDLKHVKFTETRNQFGIMNSAIYIPTMFIQTNAMNLTVSGKQNFDNRIRYLVKVNAGQVMWNKIKRYNPDMQPKKAKEKGFFNVYVVVNGTLTDYKYSRGKKNYSYSLDNMEGKFREIQSLVVYRLKVEGFVEPEEWKDDPDSPQTADDDFDPDLDVELGF